MKKSIEAFRLNSHLPGIIANACNFTNTKLIHISTDHLFDDQNNLYSEEDEVRLLNIYAKSKYEGELEVLTIANLLSFVEQIFLDMVQLIKILSANGLKNQLKIIKK